MARRHVVPVPGGGWAVKTPGRSLPDSTHQKQETAEQTAKRAVRQDGGGEVVVHRRDGRIRDSDTVAPGRDPHPPRDTRH